MQYTLTGVVVSSIPVAGNPALQQVEVNFGGVQVMINVDATDAAANWQVDATPTITFSSGP